MRFGISQISTFDASFEEDLEAYSAAGVEGIGLCEYKLTSRTPGDVREAVAAAGLQPSIGVPDARTIWPMPWQPSDSNEVAPSHSIDAVVDGIRRLDACGCPVAICLSGLAPRMTLEQQRSAMIDALRYLESETRGLAIRIALEPVHHSMKETFCSLTSFTESVEVARAVDNERIGVLVDTWHVWDEPDIDRALESAADYVFGVHINDRRVPTRGWCDRALPGDGSLDLPALLGALERGGFDGWVDLELLSDNGQFGERYSDSLWQLSSRELAQRAHDSWIAVEHKLGRGALGT